MIPLTFIIILFVACPCFTTLQASYAPLSQIKNVDESLKDDSLIKLAHSNMCYDNVGMLYEYDAAINTPKESDFVFQGSTVYIGETFCLTSAHLCDKNKKYAVRFEIRGAITPFYCADKTIKHPDYEKNRYFDIAILILKTNVNDLTGLTLSYEFSKKNCHYQDYQHLLTYTGYGAKLICNDWLYFSDQKRRAMQAYTYSCEINSYDEKAGNPGIYSMPYGSINSLAEKRPLIPYEAKGRVYLSGGAVIHPNYGLVSIHAGTACLKDNRNLFLALYMISIYLINTILEPINYYVCPIPFFNKSITMEGTVMWSVPLWPIKDWLEEVMCTNRNTCKV